MDMKWYPSVQMALDSLLGNPEYREKMLQYWVKSMATWAIQKMFVAVTDDGQGEPGGEAWKPLTKRYADRKRKAGGPMTMGVGIASKRGQKGKLKQSLVSTAAGAIGLDLQGLRGEAGSTVLHSEYFNKTRPFLPAQEFADQHGEDLFWEIWGARGNPAFGSILNGL